MTAEPQITGYRLAKRETTKRLVAEMIAAKANKYRAKKTTVDGLTFDSKREASLYFTFKAMEKAGRIANLRRQPKYILTVNGIQIAIYKPDFDYVENGALHVVDVKSEPTAKKRDFVLIKKLMAAIHGIEVEVIK